ncbi:hypothetical protein OK006_4182 [Actinobacteria bacterium OK006]|nr:hypothetical protein OK006_4182 [Actinobacteria bacterium OK006]
MIRPVGKTTGVPTGRGRSGRSRMRIGPAPPRRWPTRRSSLVGRMWIIVPHPQRTRLPCRQGGCSKSQPTGAGASLVPCPAALDVPHAPVGLVYLVRRSAIVAHPQTKPHKPFPMRYNRGITPYRRRHARAGGRDAPTRERPGRGTPDRSVRRHLRHRDDTARHQRGDPRTSGRRRVPQGPARCAAPPRRLRPQLHPHRRIPARPPPRPHRTARRAGRDHPPAPPRPRPGRCSSRPAGPRPSTIGASRRVVLPPASRAHDQ